ncbi:MAG: AEC family transporter [Anaerolineae bacterium]|nr:AEC family transporter [Anaerolineae bacterium]
MPVNGGALSGVAIPFLTILFLLLLGAALRRWGLVTLDGARQMTRLVLNVTLPPLILITLATEITPAELARAPLLVVMGIVGPLTGYLVAAVVGRMPALPGSVPALTPSRAATLQAGIAMLNTTFIGYPVCKALLGDRGLLYAVFYDAGFTLVMSTLSIWLMSWRSRPDGHALTGSLRELVRSPMLWSVVLGAVWGAAGWPMPDWFRVPLSTLGQATTPLALLSVGMLVRSEACRTPLSARPPGERWHLGALVVARLLITPLLIWGLVVLLRVDRDAAAVIVLQTAMPAAVVTTAYAEQYGGDSAFAAAGVIATTFASLLTLPAWALVLLGGAVG